MQVYVILPIFLVLLVGCETEANHNRREAHLYGREQAEVQRQIGAIPVGQPVTETNADILVSAYWRHYCSRCGMVSPVRDHGRYWAAPVLAGIVGVPKPDILVEKATGNVSWKNGPTITNWNLLWQ